MDKRIIVLIAIIAILAIGLGYIAVSHHEPVKQPVNNTTIANNTTVKNATLNQTTSSSSSQESGQYGYCAICGKALTYAEAHSEYTQGKVCHSCGANPYYQTDEGSKYANQKLYEAHPDEYSWMDDIDVDSAYDEYEDYDNSNYENEN